jgi:hypothetical protein
MGIITLTKQTLGLDRPRQASVPPPNAGTYELNFEVVPFPELKPGETITFVDTILGTGRVMLTVGLAK